MVETLIADEIVTRLTPDINAMLGRLDGLTAVQLDINTQVRAQAAKLDSLLAAMERAMLECDCAPAPTDPSVVVDPPSSPPAADLLGSVRWRESLWTVVGGQIQRDGAVVPETALTSGVTSIWVGGDGLLWQRNDAGDEYRWSSSAHWDRMQRPSITASGTIAAPV